MHRKQVLIDFIVKGLLPAFEAQKALHSKIFDIVVGNADIKRLARHGLRYSPNNRNYFDEMESLGILVRGGTIQNEPNKLLIKRIELFLNGYYRQISLSEQLLDGPNREVANGDQIQRVLTNWLTIHDQLPVMYERIRSNIEFDPLYAPMGNPLARPVALSTHSY